MYKGMCGWEVGGVGGGGRWAAEGGLQLQTGVFEGFMCPKVLFISPNKPGGPKRRLTNTRVNIRPVSLI